MNAVSYLSPTDVSFNKVNAGEGECRGKGTGSQLPHEGLLHQDGNLAYQRAT
jgi:hypothetical protein